MLFRQLEYFVTLINCGHNYQGLTVATQFGLVDIGAAGQLSPGSVAALPSGSKGRPSRAAKTRRGSR
jgi:ABC-type uncharacterized transport system permease subunit